MLGVLTPRRRLLALLATTMFLATACNLALQVDVEVAEDGSGTVTAAVGLDPDAQTRFPNLSQLLVASDLVESGWELTAPEIRQDGRQWVEVSKGFANPDDLQAVLDELFGPSNEVFSDWELVRTGDATSRTFDVVGKVDLSRGLDLFSDEALNEVLDVAPIGRDLAELEAELGAPVEDSVQLRLNVRLPGDGEQSYDIALGDSENVVISSGTENVVAELLGWVKIALLALFGVAVLLTVLNYFLDRRYAAKAPQRRPQTVTERVPQPGGGPAPVQPAGTASRMQMIVLDAHEVLFRISSDPSERLIPFIRQHQGTATNNEIIEYHRQATLGRLHAAAFWQAVGVEGEADELDALFLSGVRLQQGAKEFLREMHRRGVPVTVISNDLAEWSYRLRDLHGLSGVAPWIVSAEIGVRKPDPASFEALRRVTGVPYHSMLLVDGQIPALDTARSLGMMTGWFTPQKPADGAEPGHAVITKFADFFRRRRSEEPVNAGRRRGSRSASK